MIKDILNKKTFKVIAKPNCSKTEITGAENGTIYLNVAAPPNKNKANIEIVRFFSKLLNKKVRILSGLKNRKKVIEIEQDAL